MNIKLPVMYSQLSWQQKREVRAEYTKRQNGNCYWCKKPINIRPQMDKEIDWSLFPSGQGFLDHPIHLQHDHITGLTEGSVHAYCNAVMWQYHGR